MKKRFLTILGLSAAMLSYGQISEGGVPTTFAKVISGDFEKYNTDYHVVELNKPNLTPIYAEDAENSTKGKPYRVSILSPVSLSIENSGTWETLENGDKIWRLGIKMPEAQALSLYFSEGVNIPEGGKLHAYNNNHSQYVGAFTSKTPSFQSMEMIEGELITLEYYMPANSSTLPIIKISDVAYYYRGVDDRVALFRDGTSIEHQTRAHDNCQVDVACSEITGWEEQRDAVVHYSFVTGGSGYVCSGSMVNNTSTDCTPYFLTANHCGEPTSNANIAQHTFYFNYQRPTCVPGNTAQYTGARTQTMSGGILRASSQLGNQSAANNNQVAGTDFVLIELSTNVPSSYNPYFAGWDRTAGASSSGVGIHHPAGDEKKISTYSSAVSSATYNGGWNNAHWEVQWVSTTNGHGVTEGGSSGSPLFNSNGLIVGYLSGGSSFCTAPNQTDLYGKLRKAWTGEGSNANQQLKAWLDPTNTGATTLAGTYAPCGPAAPIADFTASATTVTAGTTVNFTDISSSTPTSWTWAISPATGWTYSGGTNASSQNPQITFNTLGQYTITLTATNAIGSDDEIKTNHINVVATASGTACDTLRNYNTATENAAAYTLNFAGYGDWGSLPGHGAYDFGPSGGPQDLQNNVTFADKYTSTTSAEVRRVRIPIFTAKDESGGGTITMNLHGANTVTPSEPGAVLTSEVINISDMTAGVFNTFDFSTPETVLGDFWISFDLNYLPTQDSVTFGTVDFDDRTASGTPNTLMLKSENGTWYACPDLYTDNTSFYMDVLMSNGDSPVLTTTNTGTDICVGGDITFDGSSSSNVTNFEWYQTDNPYTTTIASDYTNGPTFLFNGSSGDYSVVVFAEGSCETASEVIDVTVNPLVSATVTPTHTSCGNDNGSIVFTNPTGGDGANYSYSIDGVVYQSSGTFNNLASGSYTAYAKTPGSACVTSYSITINSSTGVSGSATATANICPSGTANLVASGGTSYAWYNGASLVDSDANFSASPSSTTTYTVEVSSGGCTSTYNSTVTVDPLDDASFDFFDFCDGAPNSASNIATAGGTFSLTTNPNGASINSGTGAITGATLGNTYVVMYSVAANCPNTSSESVTVSSVDDASFTTTDICDGSVNTVTGIGTTGGTFTYNGSDASSINSSTGVISNGVNGASYDIIYTTPAGICQSTSPATTVTVKTMPTVDAGATQTLCSDVDVTLTATNPNSATISWDNSVTDGVAFTQAVSTVVYTVTANLNGCIATDNVSVTVNQSPTIDAGIDQSVCDGTDVTLTATNPNAAVISWNNGISNGIPFSPNSGTTTYTATATLGTCISTDDVDVTMNIVPTVNAGIDQVVCEGDDVTLTATNPESGIIIWNNSVTDGVAFNPAVGSETYTVTSTLGACSSQDQVEVIVTAKPSIVGVVTPDDGTGNGAIDATVSGNSITSMSWSNSEITEDISDLTAGDYTLTVTDINTCSTSETFTVDSSVGLEDELNSQLSIYPNPTNGAVTIKLEGEFLMTIYDARGRLIVQEQVNNNTELNLTDYESGVYFVKINKDDTEIISKLIRK